MKTVILGIFSTLAIGAAPALAQPAETRAGMYGQLSLGGSVAGETEFDATVVGQGSISAGLDTETGLFGSAAIGRSMPSGLAIEGEIFYMQNDIDGEVLDTALGYATDPSVETTGVMLNLIYALTKAGPFTVSVGGGVGYGSSDYEIAGGSDSVDGFIWQAMAGLSYPVSETFSWEGKYRYIQGPEFTVYYDDGVDQFTADIRTSNHVLSLGGRFKF